MKDGKSHKLVIKACIPSAENLTDNPSSGKLSNPAVLPVPVTLSAVVHVPEDNFWMVADGGYCGLGKFNQEFADIETSCSGSIPNVDPFKGDFAELTTNVYWLMDLVATRGFKQKKGFVMGPSDTPHLKVCHILFEVQTYSLLDDFKLMI